MTMNKLKPMYNKILEIISDHEGLIIQESPDNYPDGKSNVYKVDFLLRLLWVAELPQPNDIYANEMQLVENRIYCASWNGFNCEIDSLTGKIISKHFIK
jgi:hypothetical protein